MEEKIEFKWYEKRQGKTFHDKKKDKKIKKEFLENRHKKETIINETSLKKNENTPRQRIKEDSFYDLQKDLVKESLFSSSKIPEDAKNLLSSFNLIIESIHPLSSKQKSLLPREIRELSHYLTDKRGERRMGYMNQTSFLISYVYYFSWWNLVRLVHLFSNMPESFFALKEGTLCLDLGSGPLTVPIALFLSRPELRKKNLVFYCMDLSQQAMAFGENIFLSVAANLKSDAWKIIRVKGGITSSIKEKVGFVSSANFLNELLDDQEKQSEVLAKKYTDSILSYFDKEEQDVRCLLVEPGDPRSAHLLSLVRSTFIKKGFSPISPCPHSFECPMKGIKGSKWCNFAFTTFSSPVFLKRLSEKAFLPKERLTLSFIALRKNVVSPSFSEEKKEFRLRIASDKIFLPGGKTGYYACSEMGLLLIVSDKILLSGDELSVPYPKKDLLLDRKSGAKLLFI